MKNESTASEQGEHCQQLFDEATAHRKVAAVKCVPVPMQIGISIVLDGELGGAGIDFPYASDFGQWLVSRKIANSYDLDDTMEDEALPAIRYYILDDSASADRAETHARAFVDFLKTRGITAANVVRLLN